MRNSLPVCLGKIFDIAPRLSSDVAQTLEFMRAFLVLGAMGGLARQRPLSLSVCYISALLCCSGSIRACLQLLPSMVDRIFGRTVDMDRNANAGLA
jgi:hypothetical protein